MKGMTPSHVNLRHIKLESPQPLFHNVVELYWERALRRLGTLASESRVCPKVSLSWVFIFFSVSILGLPDIFSARSLEISLPVSLKVSAAVFNMSFTSFLTAASSFSSAGLCSDPYR